MAPDSGEAQIEHEKYADAFRRYFVTCGRDIMVVGTDTNSSIGVRSRHDDVNAPDCDRVRGPLSIPHDNFRGRELRAIFGLHQHALPTIFFRKTARGGGIGRGKYRYAHIRLGTIRAPKIQTRSTIFVKQTDMKRVACNSCSSL